MKHLSLGAALVAGAVMLAWPAASQTAVRQPASLATDMLLANLAPNVDFLDRSSRFALTNSKDGRLKSFAHDEAREQTLAANAIDDWIEARKAPLVADASNNGDAEPPVVSGRSVAIDPPAGAQPAALPADTRLALGEEDLNSLEGLEGKAFDAEYKQKQRDALSQIADDYTAYLANGDDPALLALAKAQLPKIKHRLAEIDRL
jgi:predicted outer membrane protein